MKLSKGVLLIVGIPAVLLSGCAFSAGEKLPDLAKMADEAKQKATQVTEEVKTMKEKTEQKVEDINNAVKAVDKVFGDGEGEKK